MRTEGGRSALVLCYHAVSATWPAPLSVTPAQFRMQIERLLARGYQALTFGAACAAADQTRVLAITFDDGYRSVIDHAAPVLANLGVPATVFVPTAYMGTEGPMIWPGISRWVGTEHEPELAPLSWKELTELADAGWEVGSHSETHPHLTGLNEVDLRRELTASRATIENRLSRSCLSIAYPYGDVDPRVTAAAVEAGYQFGAALPGLVGPEDSLRFGRIGLYHGEPAWRFELKVASPVRRLRASRGLGRLIAGALARRSRKAAVRPPT